MATEADNAQSQAKAQMEHIKAMVERLEHARGGCPRSPCSVAMADPDGWDTLGSEDYHDEDAAREAIQEHPLSIQVRGPWHTTDLQYEPFAPVEYEILLCTGGPACRIRGTLGNHGEPESATLEYQDWGTPWTKHTGSEVAFPHPNQTVYQDALLTYAQQFCFGD